MRRDFRIMNHQSIIKFVKKIFSKRIIAKCKDDADYAASLHSQNYIGTVLVISYIIEILLWSCIILNTSYIIGMLWLIQC